MKGIGAVLAGLGVLTLTASAAPTKASTEVRVYLLEKETGKIVRDLEGINAKLELEGLDGVKKTVDMERVGESKLGGGNPVTGYAKDMDKWIVDMFVLPASDGLKDDMKRELMELNVGHSGPYWRAKLDPAFERDGFLAFKGGVVFDMRGDEKSVRGFDYPKGLYTSMIDSIIDTDLEPLEDQIEDGKFENVGPTSKKIQMRIDGLPRLHAKDAKVDFDRAREDAIGAVKALNGFKFDANGAKNDAKKDEAKKLIDNTEEKLKKLKDAAKDATGARLFGK